MNAVEEYSKWKRGAGNKLHVEEGSQVEKHMGKLPQGGEKCLSLCMRCHEGEIRPLGEVTARSGTI